MSEFVISGFSDEISPDFTVQLEEVKRLGIAYIEMRGVNGKNVVEHSVDEMKHIKKQMDQAGIKVSALGSPIGKINITDDFEPHFELFKHTIALAKVLETKYIRLFSFFVEEGRADAHEEEVMKRMKAFCDYVEDTAIILLHENEKDIYGDTAARCLKLHDTMNTEHLKLIFDPANFVQCGEETYPYAFNLLKDQVVYMHIKDAKSVDGEVVPSGYGDGHLPEILDQLHLNGYKGFLSLEPHLGEFVGFSALENVGDNPTFNEKSDASKFELAYKSLMKVLNPLTA